MHFLYVQIFLILNLLSLSFLVGFSHWNLNTTISKIISFSMLKSTLTTAFYKTSCHNKQEMSNSVIVLWIWTDIFIITLQTRV